MSNDKPWRDNGFVLRWILSRWTTIKDWLKMRSLIRSTKIDESVAHSFCVRPRLRTRSSSKLEIGTAFWLFSFGLVVDFASSNESDRLQTIYVFAVLELVVLLQGANPSTLICSDRDSMTRVDIFNMYCPKQDWMVLLQGHVALGLICFGRDSSRSCQYI